MGPTLKAYLQHAREQHKAIEGAGAGIRRPGWWLRIPKETLGWLQWNVEEMWSTSMPTITKQDSARKGSPE